MTSAASTTDPRTDPAPKAGLGVILRGINREFAGGVTAVEKIDLTVAPGEFVAILGPSGCGKSTLLRLIAGLDQPTGGTLQVGQAGKAAGGTKIAYVFQDAHLLPWRDVLRNVTLPLELMDMPAPRRRQAALEAVAQVGLSDAVNRYPAQLSGGMRMRVSLARALVTNPQLLLLDEPFAALDEITRQGLDQQLRQLWRKRRMTVLFVTHSINEAAFLAQRAVVLTQRPARIVADRGIALPEDRPETLRTAAVFAEQMRWLQESLQRGGSGP